jgi:hypothetical protein
MSVKRVEQIIAYGEAMVHCYETHLSAEEQRALHVWEDSDDFTRTDDWAGWAKYLGPRPVAMTARPALVRRLA